jgi:hypothetical protein
MTAGIEKLTPDNHDLYRRVQHLVRLQWKWQAIADDVGLVGPRAVQDLCEWVLEYREPKQLPMVSSQVLNVPVRAPSLTSHGVRLGIWQRQHRGARKALEAIGK